MEPIALGIYLWFKIYFLIDTNTKMWTEITDLVVFRKKLLKFLQGGIQPLPKRQWAVVSDKTQFLNSKTGVQDPRTVRGMHGGGMPGRGCAWQRGVVHGRGASMVGDGHCSRRYTSYWNAFLFCFVFWKIALKIRNWTESNSTRCIGRSRRSSGHAPSPFFCQFDAVFGNNWSK